MLIAKQKVLRFLVRGWKLRPGAGRVNRLSASPQLLTKRAVRQRIRERWERQWERETTSAPIKRLVQAPNKKTLRLYEGLTKPQCAILIQMRIMRIGLRHFLFKIKAAESDRCLCDEGSQTPKHVLMQCPRYIIPRTKLWDQLYDLGIEMDYDKIISNP